MKKDKKMKRYIFILNEYSAIHFSVFDKEEEAIAEANKNGDNYSKEEFQDGDVSIIVGDSELLNEHGSGKIVYDYAETKGYTSSSEEAQAEDEVMEFYEHLTEDEANEHAKLIRAIQKIEKKAKIRIRDKKIE
jgi:hypothetical protein